MVCISKTVCEAALASSQSDFFENSRRTSPAGQWFYKRGEADPANSNQRAKALIDHHDMPIEVGQLGEDVTFALRMPLRQQIADIANGLTPTSNIDLGLLNDAEKLILKHITGRISRLEALIQDSLFTG